MTIMRMPMEIGELLLTSTPKDQWIFKDRVGPGVYVVDGGEPDQRTTLLLQMAVAIASGKKFMGGDVTPRNVAVVTYSRNAQGLAAGFGKLDPDVAALKKKIVVQAFERLSIDDFDDVKAGLEEGDVIIIDGVPIDGIPEDIKMGSWFDIALLNLRKRYNVIMAPAMTLRGKRREHLGTVVDGFVTLGTSADFQQLHISGRSVEVSNMMFDGNDWVPAEFSGATMDHLDIVKLLRTSKPMKLEDIAKALGVKNDEKFRKRAQRVTAKGLIERVEFGVYKHPLSKLTDGQ